MGFDVFIQRFEHGAAAGGDRGAVEAVLAPYVDHRDDGYLHLVTADGDADVYGRDLGEGFMLSRPAGRIIFDVIVDIARAGGFVVMPVGCGTALVDPAMAAHLPEGVPEPIVVVGSGEELLALIQSA